MHFDTANVVERADRVIRERVLPLVYTPIAPVQVAILELPGEPISFAELMTRTADFVPFQIGEEWGGVWTTTWFRITGQVPAGVSGPMELSLDLGWFDHSVGGHAEGLVFTNTGQILKAVHPRHGWVRIPELGAPNSPLAADGSFELYVEAAANPLLLGLPPFVETQLGLQVERTPQYRLNSVELCQFHPEIWELARDIEVVRGLLTEVSETDPRHWRLARALDLALDAFDQAQPATAITSRGILAGVLSKPANASAHKVTALGHAHIDSAWLWPLRETRRKVARTVANVLWLLDNEVDFSHVMSAAQHFAWLEADYPQLFARLVEKVQQGRIVPVGGMWVESDGMLPTGESFVRQLTMGLHYFEEKLRSRPLEIWLPDSFGYCGQLPQLVRRAGYRWFLTQKISWNDTTKFPHHSFWWQGIDGTKVLTHFAPADTYAAEVTAAELAYAAANYREKAISDNSLLPTGYGDGGGGPTREMVARARRFANLEGAPQVIFQTPADFFTDLEAELSIADAPVWVGELYLERHRGTLTSQVEIKQGNRHCEALLRVTEYLCTLAAVRCIAAYPYAELADLWKLVLLNQFHDILPGSSISWVNREARASYVEIAQRAKKLCAEAAGALALSEPSQKSRWQDTSLSPLQWLTTVEPTYRAASGKQDAVLVTESDERTVVLQNKLMSVQFDAAGQVTSMVYRPQSRELVANGSSLGAFEVFRDEPIRWDAWDIDRHTLRNPIAPTPCAPPKLVADGDAKGVQFSYQFGGSQISGTWWLRPAAVDLELELEVDWADREHLLKVDFGLALAPRTASFETMYGQIERPIHDNTAADEAQFEVCMHRYVRLCEPGFGVGVVNDGTYGGDVTPLTTSTGSQGTLVRVSLVRSARFPDPAQDLGKHHYRFAIVPETSPRDTLRAAFALNAPKLVGPEFIELTGDENQRLAPLLELEPILGDIVLDWIKLADDGSGDVIARIYEPFGASARAELHPGPGLAATQVYETNLLETPDLPTALPTALRPTVGRISAAGAAVELGPFQVATLRFTI